MLSSSKPRLHSERASHAELARQLVLLYDGASVAAQLDANTRSAAGARTVAEQLMPPASTYRSIRGATKTAKIARRERQSDDGRVVLVNLTENGSVALEDYRERVSAVLGAYLAEIPDQQVEALAAATEALAQLVTLVQQRPARR
jgi:hypothetical protein